MLRVLAIVIFTVGFLMEFLPFLLAFRAGIAREKTEPDVAGSDPPLA